MLRTLLPAHVPVCARARDCPLQAQVSTNRGLCACQWLRTHASGPAARFSMLGRPRHAGGLAALAALGRLTNLRLDGCRQLTGQGLAALAAAQVSLSFLQRILVLEKFQQFALLR